MTPRTSSVRVRVSPEEEADLVDIGLRLAKGRSGIRNPDGTINVSAVLRTLIREERNRHA